MLLAVDVGNTNTVLGLFDHEGRITDSWRIKTDSRATADEMSLLYRGFLERTKVTGIAVCSSVPAVQHELRTMLGKVFPQVPHVIVEPGIKTGVPLLYDNPREVGPDRICNALAAHHLFGGPSIVVDFGTSTNFDVVSAKGEFLGGALAPGVEVGIDALATRAARLLKVEFTKPRSVIAKSTVEALQSGVIYGTAGMVDGLVERIQDELGVDSCPVIATGGLAGMVVKESRTVSHHEPDLTLVGLRLIFERNS
jgi:type III pantothenate kinase